jgi:hypothetical protein
MSRPALTDRQLGRMSFRLDLLQRRGFTEAEAEALADRLAQRDYDRDDRRMCAECAHLQERGTCFVAGLRRTDERTGKSTGGLPNTARYFTPIRTLLQRCEAFSFAKPA